MWGRKASQAIPSLNYYGCTGHVHQPFLCLSFVEHTFRSNERILGSEFGDGENDAQLRNDVTGLLTSGCLPNESKTLERKHVAF